MAQPSYEICITLCKFYLFSMIYFFYMNNTNFLSNQLEIEFLGDISFYKCVLTNFKMKQQMSYFGLGNEQPVYIKDLELLYLMSRMTKRTQK